MNSLSLIHQLATQSSNLFELDASKLCVLAFFVVVMLAVRMVKKIFVEA